MLVRRAVFSVRRPWFEGRDARGQGGEWADATLSRQLQSSTTRTVGRVTLWSVSAFGLGFLLYPTLQRLAWAALVGTTTPFALSDAAQGYVGHFLALVSLLFSILGGSSYSSLYTQNEAIFHALFREVSEAKALLEQVTLVCSNRPFFRDVVRYIQNYVKRDLCRLDRPPAVVLARKPKDDPLESILYLTSVGVPSMIYETVRSLRQRRGDRLGSVQRKLPPVQLVLLYVLGALNLVSFLLFSPAAVGGEFRLCRSLFALLASALMMTMRVIHELWTPVGGAYNVDGVLAVMIRGLDEELDARLQGRAFSTTSLPSPPPRWGAASAAAADGGAAPGGSDAEEDDEQEDAVAAGGER